MPETHSESTRATWTVEQCGFTIDYSVRVLDDIRLAVVDAFFSLARGGLEIGGVLLGTHHDRHVNISGYIPLDCEHATGPSFTLSPNDHARLAEILAEARGQAGGIHPVGWYHSHTRSDIHLSATDVVIHRRYFPEKWQVALVLKPHTFHPTKAGFFFQEPDGSMRATSSYREFVLEPLDVRPLPKSDPPPEPAPAPRRQPEVAAPPQPPSALRRQPESMASTQAPPSPPRRQTEAAITPEPLLRPREPVAPPPAQGTSPWRPSEEVAPPTNPLAALRRPNEAAPLPPPRPRPEPAPPTQESSPWQPPEEAAPPTNPLPSMRRVTDGPALPPPRPRPEPSAPAKQPPQWGSLEEVTTSASPVSAPIRLPEASPLPPPRPRPEPPPSAPVEAPKTQTLPQARLPLPKTEVEATPPRPAALVPATLANRELPQKHVHVEPPAFTTTAEPAQSRGGLRVMLALLAGLLIGGTAYQTRGIWLPRVLSGPAATPKGPYIGLATLDSGGQLQIQWDRDSPAVRNAEGATLLILDGNTAPQNVLLDATHLRTGTFTYGRQSERVDVALTLRGTAGQTAREVSTFLGKLPEPAVSARGDPAAAKAIEQNKELRDRNKKLEKTVDDLRQQLRNEQKRKRFENQNSETVK